MSNPLTKLESIKTDARIVEFILSTDYRGGRYYDRITGQKVSILGDIERWYPKISQGTIKMGIRQLRGAEPPSKPLGRPPKPPTTPIAAPVSLPAASTDQSSHNAPIEPPEAVLSRFQLVRRVDRRKALVSWGYLDSKSWDQQEVIIGDYGETIREMCRQEELNQPIVVGFKNGWPVKISNSDHEPGNNHEEEEEEE